MSPRPPVPASAHAAPVRAPASVAERERADEAAQ